jgi:hypothetical protein
MDGSGHASSFMVWVRRPGLSIRVNADNFVRAETDRMFADLERDASGVNVFSHNRTPAAIEHQTVIRLNRDTLYSFAVIDLAGGVTLTIPGHGTRYLSAMIVNNDHYVNAIYHQAGTYELTVADHGTRYVTAAVRIFADPNDPADLAKAGALQDQLRLTSPPATPFAYPDYDPASLDATRDALLALAAQSTDLARTFGRPGQVDPVRHLMGTAAGWGGLPSTEAIYIAAGPEQAGNHELTLADVPVDGFWSVSVYNARGFFEPNARGLYSVNNVTATPNADGSVTVRFGDYPEDTPNAIPTPVGWNILVRLYRPRPQILDGTWQLPKLTLARAGTSDTA